MTAVGGEPVGTAAGPERDLDAALGAVGRPLTPARRAIVRALVSASRLRTPEELLAIAREAAPGTSIATVYRTLERLQAAGRIKRARLASGAVGYAFCGPEHHEHAICTTCGAITILATCLTPDPTIEGFAAASHVLDFYGLCSTCLSESTQPHDGPEPVGPGGRGDEGYNRDSSHAGI